MSAELLEKNSDQGVERASSRRSVMPPVDIYETKDRIVLTADMPGVDEKSVDITLEKNILTIEGRVEEAGGAQTAYSEIVRGDYRRAFTINEEIDRDRIEASVKNGLLTLVLPKIEPVQKKIEVKSK